MKNLYAEPSNEYWTRKEAKAAMLQFIEDLQKSFGKADVTRKGDDFVVCYVFPGRQLRLELGLDEGVGEVELLFGYEIEVWYYLTCDIYLESTDKNYPECKSFLGRCTFNGERVPGLSTPWEEDFEFIKDALNVARNIRALF